MPADFYDLLDVDADASPEAIRRAYREKAREYHPDVNPDARSSDQFKAIRTAYEVLSDASERKDYDRMGHRTYVDQRLDGLPGMNSGGNTGSNRSARRQRGNRSRSTAAGTTARTTSRSRSSASRTGGTGGSTESRSTWGERTISEPGARARAMRARKRIGVAPVVLLAALAYLAGLATFLAPHVGVLEHLLGAATAGDMSAAVATIQSPGFASPLAYTLAAVEGVSAGLVFPVGAVAFPVVLALAAWVTGRAAGWLWALCGCGPLVGIGLATTTVVPAVGLDLALYVVLPAVALVGSGATFVRRRFV